jgi:hypothetical protein
MDGKGRAQRSRGGTSLRSSGSSQGLGADSATAAGATYGTRTAAQQAGAASRVTGLRAAYRLLQAQGLESAEAANLTAWLTGIPVRNHRWKISQIQTLMFFRQMHETGRFGATDGS